MPRVSSDEYAHQIKEAEMRVKVGGTYSHYKHPERHYKLEFIGVLENSDEICVGYRALYDEPILFVRPLENFLEEVEVEGISVPRFKLVSESEIGH